MVNARAKKKFSILNENIYEKLDPQREMEEEFFQRSELLRLLLAKNEGKLFFYDENVQSCDVLLECLR